MTKYVLAYHGTGDMPETESEVAEVMAAWGRWFESIGPGLLDGGNPFAGGVTVSSDDSVRDTPRADPLSGYSIIEADSIEAAASIAKGCPVLENAGNVEVLEAIDM